MRKKEGGQAFILVLILLMMGTLLMVPSLRLVTTALKSGQIVTRQVEAMYAADAAQEYVQWKLAYDNYAAEFVNEGDSDNFTIDMNDISVDVTVIMRAVANKGAIILSTDDTIRPTVTVAPDTVANDVRELFTFTMRLDHFSDNNSQGLDAVYSVLPKGFEDFDFVLGSCELSIDGLTPQAVPDPLAKEEGGQVRLKWPADYNHNNGNNAFSSDPLDEDHYFRGIRDFQVRQVKELSFQIWAELPKNRTHCSWVVLKPWNTLSGPEGVITVGTPDDPEEYGDDGLLVVTKVANPSVIMPGVEADVEYTISIVNRDSETHHFDEIVDYLPPEFYYTDNSTEGLTTVEPLQDLLVINDVERWELKWTHDEFPGQGAISIASGETLNLTFLTRTTKDVSGCYFNEVLVIFDISAPGIFDKIGVTDEEWSSCFSWNTGTVVVPAYDTRAQARDITIDSSIGAIVGGVIVSSWQLY